MRRALIITTVGAALSMAQAGAFDCDHTFRTGQKSTAAELSELNAATVTGSGLLHFSKCPGADCESKTYVVGGDIVVTGERRSGWVCALFPNKRGGTDGWLAESRLMPLAAAKDPPLKAWVGTWEADRNTAITITVAGNKLAVDGGSVWIGQGEGNVHDGELTGTQKPARGILSLRDPDGDDFCQADLRLVGPYLVVEDNDRCGGPNVNFTGVYRRVR